MITAVISPLLKLDEVTTRYQSLGRKDQRAWDWDRVRFAIEELDSIQISLGNHVGYVNLFITSLSSDSLYCIETVLENLGQERPACAEHDVGARDGRRRHLARTDTGAQGGGYVEGISGQDIGKHREVIKAITRDLVRCPPRLRMTRRRRWERIRIPSPDGLRPRTWIPKAATGHGKIILPRHKSAVSLRP
jgi:hypothetical protein